MCYVKHNVLETKIKQSQRYQTSHYFLASFHILLPSVFPCSLRLTWITPMSSWTEQQSCGQACQHCMARAPFSIAQGLCPACSHKLVHSLQEKVPWAGPCLGTPALAFLLQSQEKTCVLSFHWNLLEWKCPP